MSAAIAIPVWAYLLLFAVVLLALLAGMWMGYGRGWDHCEEDQHYERLRRPAGKGRHRTGADMPGVLLELPPRPADAPVSQESWLAHSAQALAVANAADFYIEDDPAGDEQAWETGEPVVVVPVVAGPVTELQLAAAAPDPCCEPCDEYARLTFERVNRETAASETDSAFTRRMAAETDELIKGIRERSNYWRHLIQDKS